MKFTTNEGCNISFAEQIIIDILTEKSIKFEREVTFDGLINPRTKQPLRYDFFIPEMNLIIEYDGKASHASSDVKYRDKIKNEFAANNKIKLVRISGINNIHAFFNGNYWSKKAKQKCKPIHTSKNKKRGVNSGIAQKSSIKAVLNRRKDFEPEKINEIAPSNKKIYFGDNVFSLDEKDTLPKPKNRTKFEIKYKAGLRYS